jgi:hypothetical protein
MSIFLGMPATCRYISTKTKQPFGKLPSRRPLQLQAHYKHSACNSASTAHAKGFFTKEKRPFDTTSAVVYWWFRKQL